LHPIVWDEVYGVGREAVVNAACHARARDIEVAIEYSAKALRLLVRAAGCGLGSPAAHREADGGLARMRERAERIGARLRVRRRAGGGTEIELYVPGGVAFQDAPSPGAPRERRE
jgi:nitrate/nitrite-specific signal transduction histidine kinase